MSHRQLPKPNPSRLIPSISLRKTFISVHKFLSRTLQQIADSLGQHNRDVIGMPFGRLNRFGHQIIEGLEILDTASQLFLLHAQMFVAFQQIPRHLQV